jgi:hypothetical protein
MAITRVRTVNRLEVFPRDPDWLVTVVYEETFDDTEDAQLPFTSDRKVVLNRYTESTDEHGNKVQNVTDISGEDAAVQAVCNALWTD